MLLQLDKEHRITIDSSRQNFQLEMLESITDRKTKETKQEWKIAGYFGGNLCSLLKRYKRETLISSDFTTLDDVLDKLDEVNKTIERVVKKQNIKLESNNA